MRTLCHETIFLGINQRLHATADKNKKLTHST